MFYFLLFTVHVDNKYNRNWLIFECFCSVNIAKQFFCYPKNAVLVLMSPDFMYLFRRFSENAILMCAF